MNLTVLASAKKGVPAPVVTTSTSSGSIGKGGTSPATSPSSSSRRWCTNRRACFGEWAVPRCQKGCGRPAPLAVKPSGYPHETCCRGCAEGGGQHDARCEAEDPPPQQRSASVAEDAAALGAAVSLLQAASGGESGSGSLTLRDRGLANRILQDRLYFWAEQLRSFDLMCTCLPNSLSLAGVGEPGCWWLAHLEIYYSELGSVVFCKVCAAQAQALQSFWRQKGARILDRGLKAEDDLQCHAMSVVRDVWGEVVDRAHCQEYCDRGTTKIVHSGTQAEYTPPSCGAVKSSYWTDSMGVSEEKATADVERVIRVAVVNGKASFDDAHLPLYHGIAARTFDGWSKSGPAFVAYPGKFGEGVYLTPSFQMACMYAFRQPRTLGADVSLAAPRFASTPDRRWNYLMVYQVMGRAAAVERFKGTAFTDAGDGWDLEAQISIVREPRDAQVYGVLCCYFPRTYAD